MFCHEKFQVPGSLSRRQPSPPGSALRRGLCPKKPIRTRTFNSLIARADHWKSYSLRPKAGSGVSSAYFEHQLKGPTQGGYAHTNNKLYVTYDPATDYHTQRQDAAKVAIPAWVAVEYSGTVAVAVTPSATSVQLTVANGSELSHQRAIRIGSEIMVINRVGGAAIVGNVVPVLRAQFGTTAGSHAVGATVEVSNNSLPNQLRVPIKTSLDGHSYFFTWDVYPTQDYMNSAVRSVLQNHKAFQFSVGNNSRDFLEIQTWFGPFSGFIPPGFSPTVDAAAIAARGYVSEGGPDDWSQSTGSAYHHSVTQLNPIKPYESGGLWRMKPSVWTRFFVRITQRANDYDLIDLWIADQNTPARQIYKGIRGSIKPAEGNTLSHFWFEFNTSTSSYRGSNEPLVSYVRNFVALVDPPADVTAFLQMPNAAPGVFPPPAPPPPTAPKKPTNLRILK